MEQDLFADLPSETIIDILSRLSVRSIALSKCVCKPWLDLLETDDFINSHHSISKSAAVLAVSMPENKDSNPCKVFELDDELDDLESHDPITKFDFPRKATFDGSADGLISLRNSKAIVDYLYICNPITREFIELPFHEEFMDSCQSRRVAFGFGASKVTGEIKVVRINYGSDQFHCHVYTLGTRRWRRVDAARASATSGYGGIFLNGMLYWKVTDSMHITWISSFDLETECFSTVSPPPVRGDSLHYDLVTLRDCLYAVDDTTDDEIVLWLLKECGAEKSWTVGYVIDQNPDYMMLSRFDSFQPIKVLKNGDILILCDEETFLCYSIKTKTYRAIHSFGTCGRRFVKSLLLAPSFRSLKRSFGMEKVRSF